MSSSTRPSKIRTKLESGPKLKAADNSTAEAMQQLRDIAQDMSRAYESACAEREERTRLLRELLPLIEMMCFEDHPILQDRYPADSGTDLLSRLQALCTESQHEP